MLDHAGLRRALDRLGWEAHEHGEATLRSVRPSEEGPLSVYLRLDEHWLVASVVPFLATGGDNSFELARWLLRMNRDMFLTKFAYDEDGDVVLTVELPTESLDFGEIETALRNLLEDAVRHRRTLRQAAQGRPA